MSADAGSRGVTLIEVLTAVVALVVIVAIAIPMWSTHQLNERRGQAIEALLAVQAAQDRYFGTHARYADASQMHLPPPGGLGLPTPGRRAYVIELERAADGLGYAVVARAVDTGAASRDARCTELRLDQHGRRSARSADGGDSSADCWNRH